MEDGACRSQEQPQVDRRSDGGGHRVDDEAVVGGVAGRVQERHAGPGPGILCVRTPTTAVKPSAPPDTSARTTCGAPRSPTVST